LKLVADEDGLAYFVSICCRTLLAYDKNLTGILNFHRLMEDHRNYDNVKLSTAKHFLESDGLCGVRGPLPSPNKQF